MTYFPQKGDVPGISTQVALAPEPGDKIIDGTFTANGVTHFYGTANFHNNVTFSSSTIIDIDSSTVYNFGDPVIELNTSFTGSYIPEAGIRIFRGDLLPDAQFLFTEDATRTTLLWQFGLAGAMKTIPALTATPTDRHAVLWDLGTSSLTTHPNIALNTTEIASSIPSMFNLPAGQPASYYRYNAVLDPAFSVERYAGGLFADAMQFGFRTFTYDGTTFTGAATASAEDSMLLRVRNPTHDRARYVFDGVASVGLDDATTALFRSDLATTRIEAATTVGLRSGTAGTDQLTVGLALVTANTDVTFGTHLLTGQDANIDAVATAAESFYLPVGLDPLPIIVGWPGTITYNGVTSTLTSAELAARTKYEIKIAYTIAAAGGNQIIYTPLNIGNDMDNVRNIYGVVRLMSGAVVQRVYGLPPNDISIEAPFDIDPPFLTIANLAGYHLLRINTLKVIGSWEILVTVETKHPLVHAP